MNCPFCQCSHSILAETKLSFAVLDNFPVSKGHTLVIPKRHVSTIWDLTADEYADVFSLVRQVKDLIQKKFDPQGINVGVRQDKRYFTPTSILCHDMPGTFLIREVECETSFPAEEVTRRGSVHERPLPDHFGRAENKLVQVRFMPGVSKTRPGDERKQPDNLETPPSAFVLGILLAVRGEISHSPRY